MKCKAAASHNSGPFALGGLTISKLDAASSLFASLNANFAIAQYSL